MPQSIILIRQSTKKCNLIPSLWTRRSRRNKHGSSIISSSNIYLLGFLGKFVDALLFFVKTRVRKTKICTGICVDIIQPISVLKSSDERRVVTNVTRTESSTRVLCKIVTGLWGPKHIRLEKNRFSRVLTALTQQQQWRTCHRTAGVDRTRRFTGSGLQRGVDGILIPKFMTIT